MPQRPLADESLSAKDAAIRDIVLALPDPDTDDPATSDDRPQAPQMLPVASFVSRTSLPWKLRRSLTMKAVDRAYSEYHAACMQGENKKSSAMKRLSLNFYSALDALLISKGNSWANVRRNKDGLLEKWHVYLAYEWSSEWSILNVKETAEVTWQVARARYGVVYLLGNTTISLEWAPILLQGLADVGAAGATIGLTATSGVTGMKDVLIAPGAAADTTQDAMIQKLAGTSAGKVTTGSRALVAGVGGALKKPSGYTAQAKAEAESVQIVTSPGYYVPSFPTTRATFDAICQTPINGPEDIPGLIVGGVIGVGVAVAIDVVVETVRTIGQNLYAAACDFLNSFAKKCFKNDLYLARLIGSQLKTIAGIIVAEVSKAAAPFVGGVAKLATGLAQCVKAANDKHDLWLDRRQITIVDGHFSLISGSVEHEVALSAASGLWTMLKGVGDVCGNVLLPGCGSLVSVLMTALEWGARLIMRLVESDRLQKFFATARELWQTERSKAEVEQYEAHGTLATRYVPRRQDDRGSIIHRPGAFKEFFESGCNASPLIPMLTLNSGICGSVYEQIQLCGPGGRVIGQSEFDAGVRYFSRLKRLSVKHMAASGMTFKGDNPFVNELVNFSVRTHQGHSAGEKVLSALSA